MADLDAFDAELRDVLRADAASVLPPPVDTVLARGRRRQRRRAGALVAGVAAIVLLAVAVLPGLNVGSAPERLAGAASTLVLAEGVDVAGPWRLEWQAPDRCLILVRQDGEGGSCDLADPPTLQETSVQVVGDPSAPETLVSGLAPDGTTAVTVTPTDGGAVEADVVRSGAATLFVARLPGVVGVGGISARAGDGSVLGSFEGPAMPPPAPPQPAAPPAYAPGARGYVETPWFVRSVGADRRSLVVAMHMPAGGCTGPQDTQALDMPEGLRLVVQVEVPLPVPLPQACPPADTVRDVPVELPRALRPDEQVLGQCDPAEPVCAALRSAAGD